MTVATTVLVGQPPGFSAGDREDRQDLVAVDDGAGGVNRKAPVGVAVEREADVGAVVDDGLAQIAEMRRPAVLVDVQAVGLVVDRDDRRPEPFERDRADAMAAPLAQSRTTPEAGKATPGASRRGARRRRRALAGASHDAADVGAGRPRLAPTEQRFDLRPRCRRRACARRDRRT